MRNAKCIEIRLSPQGIGLPLFSEPSNSPILFINQDDERGSLLIDGHITPKEGGITVEHAVFLRLGALPLAYSTLPRLHVSGNGTCDPANPFVKMLRGQHTGLEVQRRLGEIGDSLEYSPSSYLQGTGPIALYLSAELGRKAHSIFNLGIQKPLYSQ